MKIAILQLNPVVGDIDGNIKKIRDAYEQAIKDNAQLVVTPELAVIGYPPKDLLYHHPFIDDLQNKVHIFSKEITIPLLLGTIIKEKQDLYNVAIFIQEGEIKRIHRKVVLPNDDVFYESRYFKCGDEATVIDVGTKKIGVSICEDIWNREIFDILDLQNKLGADFFINISASPYDYQKPILREKLLRDITKHYQKPILYVNQVGGNDDLIFDGRSMAMNSDGQLSFCAKAYHESLDYLEFKNNIFIANVKKNFENEKEDIIEALTMGLRDYCKKCNFSDVLVGLSGGIDSALSCFFAVNAMGHKNVHAITMPSHYSSDSSTQDSFELAKRLGITIDEVSIEPMLQAFREGLKPIFSKYPIGITEENLQARIRGDILMAYSNQFPQTLLITTGNKSEISVGYCTLYGDMCGGLGVISDLYKTQVYQIAHYLNKKYDSIIPDSILNKAPSAELSFNQKDQDTLPPYDILDKILYALVEQQKSKEDLIKLGYDEEVVNDISLKLKNAEHKRHQMPPGLKISSKSFGTGRCFPIAYYFDL